MDGRVTNKILHVLLKLGWWPKQSFSKLSKINKRNTRVSINNEHIQRIKSPRLHGCIRTYELMPLWMNLPTKRRIRCLHKCNVWMNMLILASFAIFENYGVQMLLRRKVLKETLEMWPRSLSSIISRSPNLSQISHDYTQSENVAQLCNSRFVEPKLVPSGMNVIQQWK